MTTEHVSSLLKVDDSSVGILSNVIDTPVGTLRAWVSDVVAHEVGRD